jgi:hypothetical protein
MDQIVVPAHMIPAFRAFKALKNGTEKNLLITTWGGLGDQVCAEPTLRYALEQFGDKANLSLATYVPEVFRHLKFKRVFDLEQEQPAYDKYLTFQTICDQRDVAWSFLNHCIINCVDFPSLSAFRCTLPIKAKEVKLFSTPIKIPDASVVVHPGKHWPSKTFPKEWWDEVLVCLRGFGLIPVIIGKDLDDARGTVDVSTEGCVDLRNQLDLNGMVYLLQQAKVILTNDSSPIHIGASGHAFIGFVATCKHPDYISHWRMGQWSWRMKNLGRGGIWEHLDHLPNKADDVTVDQCDPELLKSWLPEPIEIAEWAACSVNQYKEEPIDKRQWRETLA